MIEKTRAADRLERLFGVATPDHELSRREAAQRVQSKNFVEGDPVPAHFVGLVQKGAASQERQPSPSLLPYFALALQSRAMWAWSFLRRSERRTVETVDSRSNLAVSTCMDLMRRLVQSGRMRGARQYLHEVIDDLLRRGQFATVDALLFSADPLKDDPRILITLLTATKPAKDRLRLRDHFFQRTADALKQRKMDEPGLLTGLE